MLHLYKDESEIVKTSERAFVAFLDDKEYEEKEMAEQVDEIDIKSLNTMYSIRHMPEEEEQVPTCVECYQAELY